MPAAQQRASRVGLILCVFLATALPPAAAGPRLPPIESSRGARVSGRVLDPAERPVAGAVVALVPDDDPAGARWTTRSDAEGKWAIVGPTPGRWRITIEAAGLVRVEGWVQVPAVGSPPPVEVEMRSLDEETPRAWEGGESTIVRWLEHGNSLLEQGRPVAARAEYEKALAVLPAAERPRVLQAVARTHFVEGDAESAVEALIRALALAPTDPQLRDLLTVLLEELGRGEEAVRLFADAEAGRLRVDEEPASASEEAAPRWPAEIERWIDAPAEPVAAGDSGRRKVRLSRQAELADLETFWRRSGLDASRFPDAAPRDLAEASFQLYVPPEAPEGGYGLLVWVSPTPFGGFSRPGVREVLERRGIVWVGADGAGNARPLWHRWALALDAAASLSELYPVDRRRVYVAGYSGGGRVASALATLYPEVFAGGFSWFGADHFHPLPVPDKPGASWPARLPEPESAVLERLREDHRFVLLTGSRDFNRSQTKATYRHLVEDGFTHVSYLEIPQADHYFGVRADWLERGLERLDEPVL